MRKLKLQLYADYLRESSAKTQKSGGSSVYYECCAK
jgi:hypothetical protein